MIKDIITANESITPNSQELAILREHFPACFRNGEFDLERFKEYLGDSLALNNEGYELRFLGKNYARLLASVDTTTVVVPDEKHNAKSENANSQNVYISGDNLDGLKHLLKSYSKQIKCIYIDPPYNSRQYSRFYHLLENLVKWKKPKLEGIALKPPVENMSEYCRSNAPHVFADLIDNLQCKFIAVSYNNTYNSKSSSSKNKISLEQIEEILNKKGVTKRYERSYKYFNSGKTDFKDHKEILFITRVG